MRVQNTERAVVQTDNIALADHVALAVHFLCLRHEAAPDFRQLRERRLAVAIELDVALGRHGVERMLHTREIAIQIGEAAILRVNHHDLPHLIVERGVEPQVRCAGCRIVGGQAACLTAGYRETEPNRRDAGENTASLGIVRVIVLTIERWVGRGNGQIVVLIHRSFLWLRLLTSSRRKSSFYMSQSAGATGGLRLQRLPVHHKARALSDLIVELHRRVIRFMGLPVDARRARRLCLLVDRFDQRAPDAFTALALQSV